MQRGSVLYRASMADFSRLLSSLWLMNAIASAPATTIKPTIAESNIREWLRVRRKPPRRPIRGCHGQTYEKYYLSKFEKNLKRWFLALIHALPKINPMISMLPFVLVFASHQHPYVLT
jgi:hypothetical protein